MAGIPKFFEKPCSKSGGPNAVANRMAYFEKNNIGGYLEYPDGRQVSVGWNERPSCAHYAWRAGRWELQKR